MLISATIIFRTRLRNIFPTLRYIVILYYRVYTAKLQLRQFSNQQIYIFLPAILTISNGLSEYREFKIYISYQAPSLLDQRYGPLRFELILSNIESKDGKKTSYIDSFVTDVPYRPLTDF